MCRRRRVIASRSHSHTGHPSSPTTTTASATPAGSGLRQSQAPSQTSSEFPHYSAAADAYTCDWLANEKMRFTEETDSWKIMRDWKMHKIKTSISANFPKGKWSNHHIASIADANIACIETHRDQTHSFEFIALFGAIQRCLAILQKNQTHHCEKIM